MLLLMLNMWVPRLSDFQLMFVMVIQNKIEGPNSNCICKSPAANSFYKFLIFDAFINFALEQLPKINPVLIELLVYV